MDHCPCHDSRVASSAVRAIVFWDRVPEAETSPDVSQFMAHCRLGESNFVVSSREGAEGSRYAAGRIPNCAGAQRGMSILLPDIRPDEFW